MTKRQHNRWRELEGKKHRGTATEAEVREAMAMRARHPEIAVADLTGEHCLSKLKRIRGACR
jgi:hypothetical protein